MKKTFIFILFAFYANVLFAQDIEVKSLKQIKASAEASTRKDLNDKTCGLLRIKMDEEGAQFSGNLVGDVVYKNGEYLLYMSSGSKRISIKHPNYLPITVLFSEFGINKLASGEEYKMATKLHKEKQKNDPKKRGIVQFHIIPSNAVLAIDNQPEASADSGNYTVSLPIGTHYYSVTYDDFTIDNQAVKVEKQPKTVEVDLTEFCPWLNIKSQDTDADIYINDEWRTTGNWSGLVAPGEYTIQARKEGFRTLSQTITLQENERFTVDFEQMKPIVGSLKVDYEPRNAEVFLDGEKVGVTPLSLDKVKPGRHKLEVKKEFCKDVSKTIIITEDQELEIKGKMPMTFWGVLLNEAEKGDGCAMHLLGIYYGQITRGTLAWEEGECYDCFKRFCKISQDSYHGVENHYDNVDFESNKPDYQKASYWLDKAIHHSPTHKYDDYKASIINDLSYCYAQQGKYDDSFRLAKICVEEYHYEYGKMLLAWHYYFGKGTAMNKSLALKLWEYIPTDSSANDVLESTL